MRFGFSIASSIVKLAARRLGGYSQALAVQNDIVAERIPKRSSAASALK